MHVNKSKTAAIETLGPVLDTALDAVVVMTREGMVAGWNEVAEQTFGWTGAEAVGRLMADLIIPEQHREAHCRGLERYNATAEERVLNRRIEITAIDKSGREFPIELSITIAGHPDEALFLGFLRDISERRTSEERLRRQASETELLFNVTRVAAETDSFEEALRACLESICAMTGWPIGHALIAAVGGRDLVSTGVWHEAIPGDSDALRVLTNATKFESGFGLPGLIMERGEPAWISDIENHPDFARKGLGFAAAFGFPIKNDGRIVAILEFFSRSPFEPDPDLMLTVRTVGEQLGRVLERRRSEEHLRLLVNELNHRVKNTLAIVQSIAVQTFRGDGIEAQRRAFESRLAALAAAHDLLTTENWEFASLRQVIEKAGLGCGAPASRLAVVGPEVKVQPRTAVSIAMAVHELCTNAVKYGALSNDSGQVTVEWDVVEPAGGGSRLQLRWTEAGGPPVTPPDRRGFGTRMIERALAAELGGSARIEFLPEGISCIVEAPLPAVAELPAG